MEMHFLASNLAYVYRKDYRYIFQNYSNEVVGKKLAEALGKLINKPAAKVNVKGMR